MSLALRVIAAASCSFGLTVLVSAMVLLLVQAAGGFVLPPLIASEMHVIAPALMSIAVCLSTALALWAVLELFPEERFHPAWCFTIGLSFTLGSLAVAAFTEYLGFAGSPFVLGLLLLGALALLAGLVSAIVYSENRILASVIVVVILALAGGAAYGVYHAFTTPGGQFGPESG